MKLSRDALYGAWVVFAAFFAAPLLFTVLHKLGESVLGAALAGVWVGAFYTYMIFEEPITTMRQMRRERMHADAQESLDRAASMDRAAQARADAERMRGPI